MRNNINAIRGELNAAIERGAPADAVTAYAAAKQLHAAEVVQPFYTGKLKFIDTAGRIEKFKNKFASAGYASLKRGKKPAETKTES